MNIKNKCPICNKSSQEGYAPFCSKRCADIDLGKWLGGLYAIPSNELDQQKLEEENED